MSFPYPYASSALGTKGAIPADGRAIRADHFNRLFRSVVALQAAIGELPEGDAASMKARLAVEMLGDGHFGRSVMCEDDPSGQNQGTRRFWDAQQQEVQLGVIGNRSFAMSIGYTMFEEPPVCMACPHQTQAQGYNEDMSRRLLVEVEPENVRLWFSAIDGTTPSTATRAVAWLVVSQNLHVYENDKTWLLPPTRTGS